MLAYLLGLLGLLALWLPGCCVARCRKKRNRGSKHVEKTLPQTFQNEAPGGPTWMPTLFKNWLQNGSKMAPKWLPGGQRLGALAKKSPQRTPAGVAPGGLLGPSGRLLGRSWGLLGCSWASFWLTESRFLELFWSPGGHFRGHFCNRGLQREKSIKKRCFFIFF